MNKQTLKRLKSFASMLPPSYYEGKFYKNSELKDLRAKEIKNSVVSVDSLSSDVLLSGHDKPVTIKGSTLYPINHARRIKEAYINKGAQGVLDYFKWVDVNNARINMKYDMKLISNILTEKVKASIKEFM